jgi:O-methyltransferase involved in polyketide biosynthesis
MKSNAFDRLDPVARTARWTAAERARESARPDRLFEDPLAEVLAGEPGRALAASNYPVTWLGTNLTAPTCSRSRIKC